MSSGAAGRAWVRSGLVLMQVSLSFVLLVGAGLLLQSLQRIRTSSPGFSTHGVLDTAVDSGGGGIRCAARAEFPGRAAGSREGAARRRVGSVCANDAAELRKLFFRRRLPLMAIKPRPRSSPSCEYNEVGPDYFATMGIPLVSGREFTRADDEKAALVAVVNETMAAQYWRGKNPIGERVQVKGRWMQVVGVAKDSKYESVRETPKPFFYVPLRQNFSRGAGLYIRTPLSPETMATALTREVHALDPESCALRGDHAARASGSLDVAAAGGRNSSWGLRWIGAATGHHRTLWRDVVCGVAEHARAGAAHGAWRGRIQSVAAGDVARLGVDGRRRVARRRGGIGIDATAWEPPIQGKPTRPAGVRVGIGGDDDRRTGSMFLARLARDAD